MSTKEREEGDKAAREACQLLKKAHAHYRAAGDDDSGGRATLITLALASVFDMETELPGTTPGLELRVFLPEGWAKIDEALREAGIVPVKGLT